MKLVFVHSEEKVRIDNNGRRYTDGSYNAEVWKRYKEFADEIVFLARREFLPLDEDIAKRRFNLLEGIKYVELPDTKKNIIDFISIKTYRKISNIIEEEIKGADAVIIRLPGNTAAINICKRLKVPYVVEVVACTFDAYWNYGIKGKMIALPFFVEMRRAVRCSQNVIYVTKAFLQRRYPTTGYNIGISDVEIQISEETISRRKRYIDTIQNRKIVIGTIGGVEVIFKGHENVIKALGQLKQKHENAQYIYEIVGAGSPERLKSIAVKYGVEDSVVFMGAMPHEKINEWLDNIDIYIQPSKQEGMPRSVIEAMARGCYCVGTDVGGIPEIIDKKNLCRKSNLVSDIVSILENITVEQFEEEASRNIEKAKNFDKNLLCKRRSAFYMKSLGEYK